MTQHIDTTTLVEEFSAIIGAENISTDADKLKLFSHDIYSYGKEIASIIIAPGSKAELAACVAAATKANRPVIGRGAGMSYTATYLPDEKFTVMIDTLRMDKILEIDEENMFVTVEVGCSWSKLYETLKAKNLRTPFWGPLSGLTSTIGGGLSQNNAFFGAGVYGPSSDSVTSLSVILADGSVVDTGSASTEGALPFMRQFGPGVKATATLRLMRLPEHEGYVSFAFKTRDDTADAVSSFSREGIGSEMFAADPKLQQARLKRESTAKDLKALGDVVSKQKSLLSGVKEAAKVAMAGRSFVDVNEYGVHISMEGRSAAAVEADLEIAREIAEKCNGREIENTIPKVLRASPFQPLNNILGGSGERWAPIHGYVPHSQAKPVWAAIENHFDDMKDEFEANGISNAFLITTLSTNAFLLEPLYYWEHSLEPLHEQTVDKNVLNKITRFAENPKGTKLVNQSKAVVSQIFVDHGATHFQIGKFYNYKDARKQTVWQLLSDIKKAVDPEGLMNPGSLGLTMPE